jgi:hypothetical protein
VTISSTAPTPRTCTAARAMTAESTSSGGWAGSGVRADPAAPLYQKLIVHTRTPLAQLLPVLATVFGSELSTMIIISTAVHLDPASFARHLASLPRCGPV